MSGIGASGLGRTQATEPAGRQAGAGSVKGGAGTGADHVNLSSLAEQLQTLDTASPAREAHLNRLAALYEAGAYQPDAEAISDAIIDDSLGQAGLKSGQE